MSKGNGMWYLLLLAAGSFLLQGHMVLAAEYGDVVQWHDQTIAIYNEAEEMIYQPIGDNGVLETQALDYLLNNDQEKTVIIPEGTTIRLDHELTIGSNTTLNVTGVTIIQMKDGAGILINQAGDTNYQSLENVVIQGGLWKNKYNKKANNMFCFLQASNIQMEDMTILANLRGNGIRLIACQKVMISNCEVRAKKIKGIKNKSVSAAVEMDPATPLLTSGLKSVINKSCVNGQTCRNITLEKCVVHGGQGIYLASARKNKKYRNQLHSTIKISGCTVTGTQAEALCMENTVDFFVKDNLLITQAGKTKGIHASGMLVQLYANQGMTKKSANRVSGNVVYGVRYGIVIRSKMKCRYGETKVISNRIHVNASKKRALQIKHCTKKILKHNKAYLS